MVDKKTKDDVGSKNIETTINNTWLTAIQLCSVPDVEQNLLSIEHELKQLEVVPENEQHIVVLPECCLFFGSKDSDQLTLAQANAQTSELENRLALLAKSYGIYLVAGSVPLMANTQDKFTNSSCVFTPDGEKIAQYDKIHLFDVEVEDKSRHYAESTYTQAGENVVCVDTQTVKLGLAICYDLRFPELFRNLATLGAEVITVPSAFTKVTGAAHWQTLLSARAIENQVYIIAAGQEGCHENGRETWGHSMIISPWGEVLACKKQGNGSVTVAFSRKELNKVRASIPVAKHNKFMTKLKKS